MHWLITYYIIFSIKYVSKCDIYQKMLSKFISAYVDLDKTSLN